MNLLEHRTETSVMMTNLANEWLPQMAGLSVKVGLLLVVVAMACALLRRRSAALRHAVWTGGLSVALLLPIGVALLPGWSPEWSRGGEAAVPVVSPGADAVAGMFVGLEVLPAAGVPLVEVAGAVEETGGGFGWSAWVMAVWLAGVLVVLGRWGIGQIGVWWIAKRFGAWDGEAILKVVRACSGQLGLEGPVRVIVGREGRMPLAWGIWHRTLLLPGDAVDWDEPRLRSVVLHELGHLVRRDPATEAIAKMAMAVYWFHPLVWLGIWRIDTEREIACDDLVVGCGVPGVAYARHLLEVVTGRGRGGMLAPPAVAMASSSKLEKRVGAVVAKGVDRRPVSAGLLGFVVLACLSVGLPLAVVRGQESEGGADDEGGGSGGENPVLASEGGGAAGTVAAGSGGDGMEVGGGRASTGESGGAFAEMESGGTGQGDAGFAPSAGDGVVSRLRELVELRRAQMRFTEESFGRGSSGPADLNAVRAALLEAEERLARAQGDREAVARVQKQMIALAQRDVRLMEERLAAGRVDQNAVIDARARLVEAELAVKQAEMTGERRRRPENSGQGLEQRLMALKVELAELSGSGLGRNHPHRVALERQLAVLESIEEEQRLKAATVEVEKQKRVLAELRQTYTDGHPQVVKQRKLIESLESLGIVEVKSGGAGAAGGGELLLRSYVLKYVAADAAGKKLRQTLEAMSVRGSVEVEADSNRVVVRAPAEIHEIIAKVVGVLDRSGE